MFPLFHDLGPEGIEFIGHLVDFKLLFIQAILNLISCFVEEYELRPGSTTVSFVLILLSDVPQSVHVEWDHAERDASLIILERLLDLDGVLLLGREHRTAVEEFQLAQNNV